MPGVQPLKKELYMYKEDSLIEKLILVACAIAVFPILWLFLAL